MNEFDLFMCVILVLCVGIGFLFKAFWDQSQTLSVFQVRLQQAQEHIQHQEDDLTKAMALCEDQRDLLAHSGRLIAAQEAKIVKLKAQLNEVYDVIGASENF